MRYVAVIVVGLLVTAALVPALAAAGLDYRIGKLFASVLVGVANYFAFPLWVFRAPAAPTSLSGRQAGSAQSRG